MKVKDLIEYRNVDIVDIDDEFYNRGKNIWRRVSPSCTSSDDCTDEEYERFLEKRVIDFKVKQSNTIPAIYISDPIEARQLGYYVCATVSKYTEEELEERRKQIEINNKMAELVRLTGRDVILGDLHKEPENSTATLAVGESLTLGPTGTYVTLNGNKAKGL